ncbi:TetR/AcrR family transcriptional regulator C-terminal domain-containing protein [Micromonospora sp. KLBMP9576]|uniref:TetR/AcrR family transcriptional regulator C-terminal domain-containing protein n=1 Tax=Micromonospora sp. KLBMP9576 TaxID=3424769 RepID=UPI003D932FDB
MYQYRQAPYQRIADALQRQIVSGELAPGDRLPSTRALAAEWQVAPGTAAKALAELQRLGVARAQARVGTVVMPPKTARARQPASRQLNREHLVQAGMAIADAEGLDGLSMRTVAARLGVATMSPYRYVSGRDELIMLMADAAYGEGRYPARPPAGWRPRLEISARLLWRLYRRHPWLARLGPLGRPLLLPNLLRHADWIAAALHGHGLSAERILDLHILLYNHGQGLAANLEREARAQADSGLTAENFEHTQAAELQGIVADERYPHFAEMLAGLDGGYDFDLDALFEFGLHALLDGFARMIDG